MVVDTHNRISGSYQIRNWKSSVQTRCIRSEWRRATDTIAVLALFRLKTYFSKKENVFLSSLGYPKPYSQYIYYLNCSAMLVMNCDIIKLIVKSKNTDAIKLLV